MDNISSNDLVTTIIPTYRRPKMLKRAIESILNQDYKHIKICVYDNASGDETENVVLEMAKKDSRIKYHCHDKNIGAFENFQYGIKQVDTSYFTLLSDDDFILDGFYENLLEGFKINSDIAFSAGAVLIINDRGNVIGANGVDRNKEGILSPAEGLIETAGSNYLTWTGIIFNSSIINGVGLLNKELWASDIDYISRSAANNPIYLTSLPCAVFVSHDSTSSAAFQIKNFWPSCMKMIEVITENKSIDEEVKSKFRKLTKDWIEDVIFRIGIKSLQSKNLDDTYITGNILLSEFNQIRKGKLLMLLSKKGFSFSISRKIAIIFIVLLRKIKRNSLKNYLLNKKYSEHLRSAI